MEFSRDNIKSLLSEYDKNKPYPCPTCGEPVKNAKLDGKMVRMDEQGRDHTPLCMKAKFAAMRKSKRPKKKKPPKKKSQKALTRRRKYRRIGITQNTYFQVGVRAALAGRKMSESPYAPHHPLGNVKHHLWKRGYEAAKYGYENTRMIYRVNEVFWDKFPNLKHVQYKREMIKKEWWIYDQAKRTGSVYRGDKPITKFKKRRSN